MPATLAPRVCQRLTLLARCEMSQHPLCKARSFRRIHDHLVQSPAIWRGNLSNMVRRKSKSRKGILFPWLVYLLPFVHTSDTSKGPTLSHIYLVPSFFETGDRYSACQGLPRRQHTDSFLWLTQVPGPHEVGPFAP